MVRPGGCTTSAGDVDAADTGAYAYRMAQTFEDLAAQALSLPAEARARLADLLVESLDGDSLTAVDGLWLAEAKRRRDEIRRGSVRPIPGDEALRAVRDAIRP